MVKIRVCRSCHFCIYRHPVYPYLTISPVYPSCYMIVLPVYHVSGAYKLTLDESYQLYGEVKSKSALGDCSALVLH